MVNLQKPYKIDGYLLSPLWQRQPLLFCNYWKFDPGIDGIRLFTARWNIITNKNFAK